ncbi:MAG: Dam family site-specific DNA-(adenine-N6)-methyltransferase [Pseudomonadota bacterium]|nr:MAG: Dam family site-specific DNA-(adenine-N6)-methyltransferase [Pseudomonadota bacterium]
MSRANDATIRPFLKWAGGKYRIIERIRELLPEGERLVEPFVGSGAVFLNTHYPTYLLADSNPDLINLYRTLRTEGAAFIAYCKRNFTARNNSAESYYRLREVFNTTRDVRRKSALFVYLNRHGYNGLCRYNARGRFNVPFGRYKRPYFPEREMWLFHEKAASARFVLGDFTTVLGDTHAGDVVYADPPYLPLSRTANFTSYSAGVFTLEDQLRLVQLAEQAAQRGVPVLVSNHDTEFVKRDYRNAHITRFPVQRFISRDGANRRPAREVLALFA